MNVSASYLHAVDESARGAAVRSGQRRGAEAAVVEQGLPSYARRQEAYHRAFRNELRSVLADVVPADACRVLDVACGDGSYAAWLSEMLGPRAEVVALDTNFSWLCAAQAKAARAGNALQMEPIACDALRLPFADACFDIVWCAHSLYTLPDVAATLAEMRRVTRPGGTVAVLESDTLHEIVLPWPPELELAVRQAELAAFSQSDARPDKYYAGRFLLRHFRRAGFRCCSVRAYAASRAGPPDAYLRRYLQGYLSELRQRVASFLDPESCDALDGLLSSNGTAGLFIGEEFAVTCLNYLVWGTP